MASSYSQRTSPHVGHIDTTLGEEKKKQAPPPLHLHQNPGHHQLDSFLWRQFATICWGSCLPGIISPLSPWCVSTASNTHARTARSGAATHNRGEAPSQREIRTHHFLAGQGGRI